MLLYTGGDIGILSQTKSKTRKERERPVNRIFGRTPVSTTSAFLTLLLLTLGYSQHTTHCTISLSVQLQNREIAKGPWIHDHCPVNFQTTLWKRVLHCVCRCVAFLAFCLLIQHIYVYICFFYYRYTTLLSRCGSLFRTSLKNIFAPH